jgi:hypothetical protein
LPPLFGRINADGLAAKIRSTPPWVLFLWLAATEVVYAYVGKLILFIVGFVLVIRGWLWLSFRFPLTMLFVNSFIAALLGGRRRRQSKCAPSGSSYIRRKRLARVAAARGVAAPSILISAVSSAAS